MGKPKYFKLLGGFFDNFLPIWRNHLSLWGLFCLLIPAPMNLPWPERVADLTKQMKCELMFLFVHGATYWKGGHNVKADRT